MPGNDFTGWFLQLRNRIENNPYGLFFFSCKTKQSGFYLHIENKDTEVKDIFIAVGELITELDYSKIKIECGNSILETNEWLKHLNNIKKVK